MELGARFTCTSDAATTYDGGPITDPGIILALMKAIAEMMSWILVTWLRKFKVVCYPIIDIVRKIYYSHFLHQCTVAHGIKRLCKVRRDQQDVIILLKH